MDMTGNCGSMSEGFRRQANGTFGSLIKFIDFGTLGLPLSERYEPEAEERIIQGEGNAT